MTSVQPVASGEKLLAFIPQRAPFIMVDKLFECTEKSVRTGFEPKEDNIFSAHGFFTEPGLIENMAQSAAAGTGFYLQATGKPIPVGYIGAIKDFQLSRLPVINKPLFTEVNVIAEVLNATVIRASVSQEGNEVASCEMKIFLLDSNVRG